MKNGIYNFWLKIIIFCSLILTAASGYCQKTYPAKSLNGNDTVCVISIPQVKIINKVFAERNFYKLATDTLFNLVYQYKEQNKTDEAIIKEMGKQYMLCDSLYNIQMKISKEYQGEIAVLTQKNKRLRLYNTGIIAAIVVLSLTKIFLK